jgi:hypothetical protein
MEENTMTNALDLDAGHNRISEPRLDQRIDASPRQGATAHTGLSGSARSHADRSGETLATFLGWFSVGLGATQLIAPRELTRMIGLRPTRRRTTVMQLMGVREIAHGAAILSNPPARSE